ASGIRLTPVQEQTLRLAAARGEVRRRDIASVCGISPELARRALRGLEQAGVLGRTGRARGTRYVLRSRGEGWRNTTEAPRHRGSGISCYDRAPSSFSKLWHRLWGGGD